MASDVVRVMCPNLKCRTVLSVPSAARGKTVRCRQCGGRVRIPETPTQPRPQVAETHPDDAPASPK